jgi:hypothetical protein
VTDVQQIEASIRESDAPALGAVACHYINELIFRKDFAHISTSGFTFHFSTFNF